MITTIPNGILEILNCYGNPREKNFELKNIVLVSNLPYTLYYDNNPITRFRCHKLVVDNFITAFKNIRNTNLTEQVKEFNGIYAFRPIRGKVDQLSLHSFGVAIDLEASRFPLGSSKRMEPAVIECFKKAGFFYGGDFKNRKDPMHFQLATGY